MHQVPASLQNPKEISSADNKINITSIMGLRENRAETDANVPRRREVHLPVEIWSNIVRILIDDLRINTPAHDYYDLSKDYNRYTFDSKFATPQNEGNLLSLRLVSRVLNGATSPLVFHSRILAHVSFMSLRLERTSPLIKLDQIALLLKRLHIQSLEMKDMPLFLDLVSYCKNLKQLSYPLNYYANRFSRGYDPKEECNHLQGFTKHVGTAFLKHNPNNSHLVLNLRDGQRVELSCVDISDSFVSDQETRSGKTRRVHRSFQEFHHNKDLHPDTMQLCFQSITILTKIDPNRAGLTVWIGKLPPSRSFTLRRVGPIKVEGIPLAQNWVQGFNLNLLTNLTVESCDLPVVRSCLPADFGKELRSLRIERVPNQPRREEVLCFKDILQRLMKGGCLLKLELLGYWRRLIGEQDLNGIGPQLRYLTLHQYKTDAENLFSTSVSELKQMNRNFPDLQGLSVLVSPPDHQELEFLSVFKDFFLQLRHLDLYFDGTISQSFDIIKPNPDADDEILDPDQESAHALINHLFASKTSGEFREIKIILNYDRYHAPSKFTEWNAEYDYPPDLEGKEWDEARVWKGTSIPNAPIHTSKVKITCNSWCVKCTAFRRFLNTCLCQDCIGLRLDVEDQDEEDRRNLLLNRLVSDPEDESDEDDWYQAEDSDDDDQRLVNTNTEEESERGDDTTETTLQKQIPEQKSGVLEEDSKPAKTSLWQILGRRSILSMDPVDEEAVDNEENYD